MFGAQASERSNAASRFAEPAIAIVTDNKDPSKLGRVKLKIPVLSDDDTTFWVPVAMHGAGKNRGWFFIPEVNDEVLVVFEHGDANRPIVLGALWNGKDKPPDKNPGGNPRRVIKSRQGNKITFDDDQGKLIIEDGGGKGRITFDSGSNKMTIEALDGDVCLQAPTGALQIVAQSAEFKATQNLEIFAGSTLAMGTDTSAKVNGQAVTLAGTPLNINCGGAQAPQAPTASPADVEDPYGS